MEVGFIEEIPVQKWDEEHYLLHRPVVKKSGTTRVRTVFDALVRERGQPSVNQCLQKGVNLIEIMTAILLRFRLHRIEIIADITKAFLQISPRMRPGFPQVLWFNKEGDLKIFQHARVTFGVINSPFLLGAVIDFHLKMYNEGSEVTTEYTRSTTEKLRRGLYANNFVTSVENERELRLFIKKAH